MDPNISAVLISIITLGLVFFWPKPWGKLIPGALAALVIGTLISFVITGAPVLGDIPTGFPEFVMPEFTRETLPVVLEAGADLGDSRCHRLVVDLPGRR